MPIYSYKCEKCEKIQDLTKKIDDRDDCPECCGQTTKKIITNFKVHPDFEPYIDENISDRPILVKSKKHRLQLLKENGLIEAYGKGWF